MNAITIQRTKLTRLPEVLILNIFQFINQIHTYSYMITTCKQLYEQRNWGAYFQYCRNNSDWIVKQELMPAIPVEAKSKFTGLSVKHCHCYGEESSRQYFYYLQMLELAQFKRLTSLHIFSLTYLGAMLELLERPLHMISFTYLMHLSLVNIEYQFVDELAKFGCFPSLTYLHAQCNDNRNDASALISLTKAAPSLNHLSVNTSYTSIVSVIPLLAIEALRQYGSFAAMQFTTFTFFPSGFTYDRKTSAFLQHFRFINLRNVYDHNLMNELHSLNHAIKQNKRNNYPFVRVSMSSFSTLGHAMRYCITDAVSLECILLVSFKENISALNCIRLTSIHMPMCQNDGLYNIPRLHCCNALN